MRKGEHFVLTDNGCGCGTGPFMVATADFSVDEHMRAYHAILPGGACTHSGFAKRLADLGLATALEVLPINVDSEQPEQDLVDQARKWVKRAEESAATHPEDGRFVDSARAFLARVEHNYVLPSEP